jgi:hypothetical protein
MQSSESEVDRALCVLRDNWKLSVSKPSLPRDQTHMVQMAATADKRGEGDDMGSFHGSDINRIHSKKTKNHALLHVANLCFEEPDAVVPHVRVCGDVSR